MRKIDSCHHRSRPYASPYCLLETQYVIHTTAHLSIILRTCLLANLSPRVTNNLTLKAIAPEGRPRDMISIYYQQTTDGWTPCHLHMRQGTAEARVCRARARVNRGLVATTHTSCPCLTATYLCPILGRKYRRLTSPPPLKPLTRLRTIGSTITSAWVLVCIFTVSRSAIRR
jgi:hypothetical protein